MHVGDHQNIVHTHLYSVPAKVETRQYHLPKSETRPKGGEEANRYYTQNIDEENDQYCVDKSKSKDRIGKRSNSESANYHVCREPLVFINNCISMESDSVDYIPLCRPGTFQHQDVHHLEHAQYLSAPRQTSRQLSVPLHTSYHQ